MLFYFSFIIIAKIILAQPLCRERTNNCSKCNPVTKLCIKCEKDIYTPDENGGCKYAKKCELGRNHCIKCLEDN